MWLTPIWRPAAVTRPEVPNPFFMYISTTKISQGCPLVRSSLVYFRDQFVLFLSVARPPRQQLALHYLGLKQGMSKSMGIYIRKSVVREKSVVAVFMHCDLTLQHYTSNTTKTLHAGFFPSEPITMPPALQRLSCPQRAASLCSDAWPLPLGP